MSSITAQDKEYEAREQAQAPGDDQPMSDRGNNRSLRPTSSVFKEFMKSGWAPQDVAIEPLESSTYTPQRRETLARRFPQDRLVIPAGQPKVRNNDCDFMFRADSAFAYYTGLGEDFEPGAVLVINPTSDTNVASAIDKQAEQPLAELFVAPRADNSTETYYSDPHYGEYWIGARPGVKELAAMTGIPTRDIAQLTQALEQGVGAGEGEIRLRVLEDADPDITTLVDTIRARHGLTDVDRNEALDNKLREFASESRMVKDSYEISEMRKAIAATKDGFDRILSRLPFAVGKQRSERMLEGAFTSVAREQGNGVGYDSIVASGVHAPTLHWIRNTGVVAKGDMLLIDAGVEMTSLYTADITRTFPVGGKFSPLQRKLYQAVLDSQQAGFEAAKPGATYSDIHHACMRVIAERLREWGVLDVDVETSLSPEGQQHRRWLASGVAHHLGLDVHDCAQARYEQYQGAKIMPGMIFTIEPGLYLAQNDELLPEEMRGIGIRIEDDVLMTEHGPEWLSHAIPKQIDEVEAWMAERANAADEFARAAQA